MSVDTAKPATTSLTPPTPGGLVNTGRTWSPRAATFGHRTMGHPDLLATDKIQEANPLARVVSRNESAEIGKRWSDVYDNAVKGTYLNEPGFAESRPYAKGYGYRNPNIYGGMLWHDTPQENGRFHLAAKPPIRDFTDMANRIRPDNFLVMRDRESNTSGRTAYAYPRGVNAFSDYRNGGGSMTMNTPNVQNDGNVANHELEHTMQSQVAARDNALDDTSVFETPAVVAGAATEARASARGGERPPEQQERINNSRWTLPPNPETGALRRGLTAKTMASQYDKWGYGNNRQGQQVQPAQTMTELLSTPEGQNYLKLLNSEVPGSAPSELDRFLDKDTKLSEIRAMRQAALDREYQYGEHEREGFKIRSPDGTSARDSSSDEIDYYDKKLREAEGSKKASAAIMLAAALVSTQNGNQNIMKTASYAHQDMTKEAGIGELLSGLGGQASSFINNMPNNPAWQNGLAGGGGAAILMLLLNLLTGNKMGRGMLPAMMAGGALGAGMPAFYNYMNRPSADAPIEMHGPPKPIPEFGPPGPNQMQDSVGRIHTLNPMQIRQRDRASKVVAPGTVRELLNDIENTAEKFWWDRTGPARGVVSKIDETARNVKKNGLSALIDTPYTGALKDPYEASKYSAPDFH